MTEIRDRGNEGTVHPRGTQSSVFLVTFLAAVTAVFLLAEFGHLHPLMELFYRLALVF